MRGDLRRLLWRLRAGVVRRAALEAAVEEACRALVESRFREAVELQEVSQFARSSLAIFEAQISMARHLALEGEHRRAVRAVEAAEAALAAARRLAEVHAAWEALVEAWKELVRRYDFEAFGHLATLREGARGLVVAEAFLRNGESRKARFVVRQCAAFLETLTRPVTSRDRSRALLHRLLAGRQAAHSRPDSLVRLLGRIADDGLLDLAERLFDDWEMGAEAGRTQAATRSTTPARGREALIRMSRIEQEARSLGSELAELGRDRAAGAERSDRTPRDVENHKDG